MRSFLRAAAAVAAVAVIAVACDKKSPPTTPSARVTQVQVGVAGNAQAVLAPGESKQLFAIAMNSDGTTMDVTNLATWQSSNPSLATVSTGGLLAAAAEGAVDVSATYSTVRGSSKSLGCPA